jgi:Fur family peroxide stress response transcriptional regulator
MTAQRAAVYEALCQAPEHPTAEALFFAVRDRLPGISLATVYNTLETLVDGGLAVKILGEGAARYDSLCAPHGHTRCAACHALTDLPEGEIATLVAGVKLPPGFVPRTVSMEIEGLCANCAATDAESDDRG